MSLGLRNRSKVNWVQNNKIIERTLLSMSSPVFITSIKFTDTIQDVLKILGACITWPRQQLSICPCNFKGHLSAYFAKIIKVCNVNAALFYRCHTNLSVTIQTYQKLHVNGLEVMISDIDSVTTGQAGQN